MVFDRKKSESLTCICIESNLLWTSENNNTNTLHVFVTSFKNVLFLSLHFTTFHHFVLAYHKKTQ